MKMSYCELKALFRALPAVELPKGYYRGTVLWGEKGTCRKPTASLTRLVWQGKWVCPEEGSMVNRAFGKAMLPTDAYMGESFLDGGAAMIFDYSRTPAKFARSARDEVRQVCPGFYLGAMYLARDCECPKLANFFLVEAECGR